MHNAPATLDIGAPSLAGIRGVRRGHIKGGCKNLGWTGRTAAVRLAADAATCFTWFGCGGGVASTIPTIPILPTASISFITPIRCAVGGVAVPMQHVTGSLVVVDMATDE